MTDAYLAAQLRGEFAPKAKSAGNEDPAYEKELEKIAEEYAKEEAGAVAAASPLLNKEQAKIHLKIEFKEAVRLKDQQVLLKQAVRTIMEDGKRYLSKELWELLSKEIGHASEVLDKLTYKEEVPDILFPYLGMTQEGMNAIDTIGQAKYKEENFSLAVAINALLATLNPESITYWLRLGISYQDSGFYEKAIKAYSICHVLDPLHISSWIFCAECYFYAHNKDDAKIEYEEAVKIVASLEDKAQWEEQLAFLKKSLHF